MLLCAALIGYSSSLKRADALFPFRRLLAYRTDPLLLISLEQTPSRLISCAHRSSPLVSHVDCISAPPFASTSSTPLPAGLVDLHAEHGVQQLEKLVLEVIKQKKSEGKKLLVVLDSVDALAEKGVHAVFSLVKKVLKGLDGSPSGAPFPPRSVAL